MPITSFTSANNYAGYDELHLHYGARKAIANITMITMTDKATHQFIVYSPSMDVSGYGETEVKATEMFKSSIDDFFVFLTTLSSKKCSEELSKLGWRPNQFKRKDFKKPINDQAVTEQANIFNAKIESVQRMNVAA